MPTSRTLLRVATVGATAMLVLTACMGGSEQKRSADPQPLATQPSEAIATTTAATPATPAPTEETTPPPVAPATPTALPQFDQLNAVSAYRAGRTPKSPTLNGSANVPVYLQAVMQSSRDIWRATLTTDGLVMPGVTYDVTSRSDRYVSACTRNGKAIVVTAGYGRLFYCKDDRPPFGAIALPANVIADIWKKTNRKTADLAGAITVTRTSALVVTASLQQQLGLPALKPTSRQYVATCLSGVWAHAVYAQNSFTEKELAVALEHASKIGSEVDGTVVPVDTSMSSVTAWMVGYRSGKVGACGASFWH